MSRVTRRDRRVGQWMGLDFAWAAKEIEQIDASDPERAHTHADAILLANSHPDLVDAYAALEKRCAWWASA